MGDLQGEIVANVQLVKEKKRARGVGGGGGETDQFVQVLGEDVKQFLSCMKEELEAVVGAIIERDDKCKLDMERIEQKLSISISLGHPYFTAKSSNEYQSEMSEFTNPTGSTTAAERKEF